MFCLLNAFFPPASFWGLGFRVLTKFYAKVSALKLRQLASGAHEIGGATHEGFHIPHGLSEHAKPSPSNAQPESKIRLEVLHGAGEGVLDSLQHLQGVETSSMTVLRTSSLDLSRGLPASAWGLWYALETLAKLIRTYQMSRNHKPPTPSKPRKVTKPPTNPRTPSKPTKSHQTPPPTTPKQNRLTV